jgi:hypothetical protein
MNDEHLEKLLREIDEEDDYAWLKETNAELREKIGILFNKNKQLETENAALRADVLEQCTLNAKGSEREYSLRGGIEQLQRELAAEREKAERYRLVTLRQDADNTALCNKLAALENQTQWKCSCGGTDCEGQKENAALREDKEILDWMNGNIEAIMFKYKPDGFIWDVREIMRGAMAKEDKPDA